MSTIATIPFSFLLWILLIIVLFTLGFTAGLICVRFVRLRYQKEKKYTYISLLTFLTPGIAYTCLFSFYYYGICSKITSDSFSFGILLDIDIHVQLLKNPTHSDQSVRLLIFDSSLKTLSLKQFLRDSLDISLEKARNLIAESMEIDPVSRIFLC